MVSQALRELGVAAIVTLTLIGVTTLAAMGTYVEATHSSPASNALTGLVGSSYAPSAMSLAVTSGFLLLVAGILFSMRALAT